MKESYNYKFTTGLFEPLTCFGGSSSRCSASSDYSDIAGVKDIFCGKERGRGMVTCNRQEPTAISARKYREYCCIPASKRARMGSTIDCTWLSNSPRVNLSFVKGGWGGEDNWFQNDECRSRHDVSECAPAFLLEFHQAGFWYH